IENASWARFGSGAEDTSCRIEVPRSPFLTPELPTPSPACGVLVPGQFEIRPNPFSRKVGGLAHSVQSDQRRFVYCLGLDSEGGLPVLDPSRFCVDVATSSGFIGRSIEVQCLLLLLVPMLIIARVTAPMYEMYLRGVWDYQRNRWCQDGRLEKTYLREEWILSLYTRNAPRYFGSKSVRNQRKYSSILRIFIEIACDKSAGHIEPGARYVHLRGFGPSGPNIRNIM
ncbi:hypothetical protein PIB30_099203, partial [Stylosanthes scabra]|nr:hypothetical protein [Stylosanthes scabra]